MKTLILYCAVVFFSVSAVTAQTKSNEKNIVWKETVGRLNRIGYHIGTIYYKVDTVIYAAEFEHLNNNAVLGERYTMRYNVNKPTEVDIDYWRPVFEKGENTLFTTGRITSVDGKVNMFHPKAAVRYACAINGVKYNKWIYLPPNFQELYPNLKEGQSYQVEYLQKDINRVVLHLDRPSAN
jgi:hypothetical protein